MSRKPSVILTPTERKASLQTAKGDAKTAKTELARLNKESSVLNKEYLKANKAREVEYEKNLKAIAKAVMACSRDVTKAEDAISQLEFPKSSRAKPSPTVIVEPPFQTNATG